MKKNKNKVLQAVESDLQIIQEKRSRLQKIRVFNIIYILVSTMVVSFLLYWTFSLWWDGEQYEKLYRQSGLVLVFSILNVLLALGPMFYSIYTGQILSCSVAISSFFFVLSILLMVGYLQLYRGKEEWFRNHITPVLYFLVFSLMLQWVGYVASIIRKDMDISNSMSFFRQGKKLAQNQFGFKKRNKYPK